MSAPAWMPLYVSDYLADTGHLSTLEHGAYMLLIMHYWQNGGLPKDDSKLARISRVSPKEWASIRPTLAEVFGPDWTHKRIDEELARAAEKMDKRSAAGKAGANARYGKRSAVAMANAEQTDTQPPSPAPKHEDAASAASSGAAPESSFSQEVREDLEARLYEAIELDGDPPPSLRDISPMLALLDKGYDLDVDILPKLRAITAKGKRGRSWNYYLPSITEGHETTAAIPAKPPPPAAVALVWVTEDDPRWPILKARHIAEKGRPPVAMGSKHENGIGSHFPQEWASAA